MRRAIGLIVVSCLTVGDFDFAVQRDAHAAACETIVGKWAWFTKGVVTFKPDGTMVHEPGNHGTWECTDAAWGRITLRWQIGGYVNRLALSTDGNGLFSTDPSQAFVTAKRVGVGTDAKARKESQAKASGNEHIEDHDVWKSEPAPKTEDKARQREARVNKGIDLYNKKKYDEAIAEFTKAIEIMPSHAHAYRARGVVYFTKSQWDQAVADFTKAIEINPNNAEAYNNRGNSYYRNGEYAKGLDDLNKAKALGYKVSANVLDELRKASQAAKELDQRVTPEDSREIARIVEGLSQHYKGGLYFHWPGSSVDDDGYIRKGYSVTIGEGLTLVKRYLQCTMPNPNWLSSDDPRAKYRMSAESVADCDKQRHGLKWEEKTERSPLAQIGPASIKLPKTDKGDSKSDLSLTFWYEGYDANEIPVFRKNKIEFKGPPGFTGIECKGHTTCGQMAADLKKLVEIAGKSAAPKKTSSPESTTKGAGTTTPR
jgi:tetratricopeptide (TPR) repeat protein